MHLAQTKAGSLRTGGPQYYLHDVPEHLRDYLRKKKVLPVVLHTPYGISESPFLAVSSDYKLDWRGRPIPGNVGHDRIQRAKDGTVSIGEEIRAWYALPTGRDFERIELEGEIKGTRLIMTPTQVVFRGVGRPATLEREPSPLSFHSRYLSTLWQRQIAHVLKTRRSAMPWMVEQMEQVLNAHCAETHIHEADLLRVAGAFDLLGVKIGPYLVKLYDCAQSAFEFLHYRRYSCPVEIKKKSAGFQHQLHRRAGMDRVVVLCLEHDLKNPPGEVDILELAFMCDHLRKQL